MIKVIEDIQKIEDLKEFAEAQYYTIINQSKKIKNLEDNKEALELKISNTISTTNIIDSNNTDAETICITQLRFLKLNSEIRELTLEETKKVETYTKTLLLIKGKDTEDKINNKEITKGMSTDQLLKLVSKEIEQ